LKSATTERRLSFCHLCKANDEEAKISDVMVTKLGQYGLDAETVNAYKKLFKADKYADTSKWYTCHLGCGNVVAVPDAAERSAKDFVAERTCECGTKYCLRCLCPPHTGVTCEAKQKKMKAADDKVISEGHGIRCYCNAVMAHGTDCKYINCPSCQQEWCWICKQPMEVHHQPHECKAAKVQPTPPPKNVAAPTKKEAHPKVKNSVGPKVTHISVYEKDYPMPALMDDDDGESDEEEMCFGEHQPRCKDMKCAINKKKAKEGKCECGEMWMFFRTVLYKKTFVCHDCNWKGSSRKAKHLDGDLFCPECVDLKPVVLQNCPECGAGDEHD